MILNKDLISIKDLTKEQIGSILSTAETMKVLMDQNSKKALHLEGHTAVLYFHNQQSRKKLAYELASKYLSASVADLSGTQLVVENIVELGKIIEQMGANFIIVRHNLAGSAKRLAESVSAHVINVGDGNNENPVKGMLDLMTIKRHKGDFENLKVAFIGDLTNYKDCKSTIVGLVKLGAKVTGSGPCTLIDKSIEKLGIKIYDNPLKAVENADVIVSVGLRHEEYYKKTLPSFNEYKSFFKIDGSMISNANESVLVLSSGKVKRGIEISSTLIDMEEKSIVENKMSDSVAMNMAILYLLSMSGR